MPHQKLPVDIEIVISGLILLIGDSICLPI
jgi:hypothetical protein